MCGIVGYVGTQQATPVLLEGLTRLEHRGYDSAGVALLGSTGIKVAKRAGRVRDLADALPKRFAGRIGIGHTRWATHGPANDVNAHPHTDGKGLVAVVHADFPDRMVVARNGSPLLIGVGDKEMYVASDLAAVVRHTTTLAHLADGEIATVTASGFTTYGGDLRPVTRTAETVDVDPTAYEAGDHQSFMHK